MPLYAEMIKRQNNLSYFYMLNNEVVVLVVKPTNPKMTQNQ